MTWWYSLVSLLPFEWAAPDTMLFMKNALLAVLIISPLFGILSTMVVHSRMSFFSDALGHSAFTGMAIGAICGFQEPTWAAVIFAILFALLFNVVRRRSALGSDTVIGVFSSTAVALGIFLSTLNGRSFTKFNNLLIGDILSVEPGKIGVLALILVLVIALWVLSFNQLMLSAVHPALADSRGIRVFWQETVFSIAIAVVVTLSMTWVGLLVINSLLVLPAAAARNLARNMRQYHLFSLLGAVLAGVVEPPSATPVIVEDDVVIGANAVVLEGVRIGKGAVVAAGAVVTEDVAPNMVVAGTPARVIKQKDEKTLGKTELVAALRELK